MNITVRNRSARNRVGAILLLGALAATAVGLASLEDIRRYLRMRNM